MRSLHAHVQDHTLLPKSCTMESYVSKGFTPLTNHSPFHREHLLFTQRWHMGLRSHALIELSVFLANDWLHCLCFKALFLIFNHKRVPPLIFIVFLILKQLTLYVGIPKSFDECLKLRKHLKLLSIFNVTRIKKKKQLIPNIPFAWYWVIVQFYKYLEEYNNVINI